MSIKGIDTQIMVTRTAELAKDSHTQVKKDETNQNFLSVQTMAAAEAETHKVSDANQPEQSGLQLNADKESEGSHGRRRKKKQDNEEEEETDTSPSSLVPPGNNIIDIKV